ncbi:hypothetical protein [Jiangella asiatica]|uniref:Uncharacterized protein n=1 Tax=Jiangella asiatica TaxID=2530372 RepID=A0A4R5CCQ6_9ACTN|nr:hypothetical protein [Jiangella asiatica]TDD97245.1 hypothetical protein E1269_29790 [Jiangella asiatica]
MDSVDAVFAAAARRRRRMLVVLLLAVVASVGLVLVGRAPGWLPAGPGLLLLLFLFVARRAVVAQARRRRDVVRRRSVARRRALAAARAAAVVAEEPAADEEVSRRLVLPADVVEDAVGDGDSWSPVPVPLPTYLTKPKAPRPAARKIDLSQPGAWTSGSLDPASSIELPRREPAERPAAATGTDGAVSEGSSGTEAGMDEQQPEHRRAVGD